MRKLSSPALLALSFATLGVATGCGDDSGDEGGAGDRRGRFDDPSDFDRSDCASDAPLDSIDPAGIWHVDTTFIGYGNQTGAVRIDPEEAGRFVALVFGDATEDVRLSADDLFIRHETDVGGDEEVVAIDLCRVQADGGLSGLIASCFGPECIVGQIRAYPVAPLDEPEAESMTLLSEWSGSESEPWDVREVTYNVRHRGNRAYVARGRDGLRVVDLEDPAQPADLGHLPATFAPEEYYNDVKVTEASDGAIYAFLASNVRGVVVADVTDPAAPVEVAAFPDPIGSGGVNVHTLFVEGDLLYAASTSIGGLQIFDIADPASASAVGGFVHPDVGTLGGFVHDLFVEDGVAYLNYWNLGMVAVDTTGDPAAPSVVGVFDGYDRRTSHSNWVAVAGGRRVAVHGDEDFDAHVRVVDVDPDSSTAFEEIGAYQTRPAVSVHNIMAVGELALVTYYQDGLRVLDLADPTSPVEVAHFDTWPGAEPGYGQSFYEGAIGVDHDAERDLILLADTHRGLLVLTLDR